VRARALGAAAAVLPESRRAGRRRRGGRGGGGDRAVAADGCLKDVSLISLFIRLYLNRALTRCADMPDYFPQPGEVTEHISRDWIFRAEDPPRFLNTVAQRLLSI